MLEKARRKGEGGGEGREQDKKRVNVRCEKKDKNRIQTDTH